MKLLVFCCAIFPAMTWIGSAFAEPMPVIGDTYHTGDFKLVADKQAAELYVGQEDFKVVHIAAECLAADLERVSGVRPTIQKDSAHLSAPVVLIGTLGKSPVMDGLVRSGKLDVQSIAGKWESFLITTVNDPMPGVPIALVVAGSDRRGTAYGVFELSESIGVSPWYWWADVAPRHRETLVVAQGTQRFGPPSVKYRGIFINDEDWGLQPWAAKTFEPETKDIGPKTYARVFELLLRLKANYLWPAMHPCTKAFNLYPQNKVVADDYAIVMGSSHAEPMLRDNVTEWDEKTMGEWNYDTNRDTIYKYWDQRVQENGRFENVYTIGMRGIHDSAMPGGGSMADKVARLDHVIKDQREMLSRWINPNPALVPQIFCPYKEVLGLYQNGLKVPDDVALVWADDNHGYIRQLSTPEEQKRSGGAGVYYHLSYWGKPEDYLWLYTTPPALVWEEMSKAYDHGATTLWVANVGDIKPAEIGMEFFLRMAWNTKRWTIASQPDFLNDWARRTFGEDHAAEIAELMNEYYRLNYSSKPEHSLLNGFSLEHYQEAEQRLERFSKIVEKANRIYSQIPPDRRDGFYELVVYPVRCASLMNEKQINANRSKAAVASGDQKRAAEDAAKALKAHDQIQVETAYYNNTLAGGKWKNIISASPRDRPVFQKPVVSVPPVADPVSPDTNTVSVPQDESVKSPALDAAESPDGFVAHDGYVSIEAEHPSRRISWGGARWEVIEGLGRTGDSITVLPTTTPSVDKVELLASQAPRLEYDFAGAEAPKAKITAYCIPTHAIHPGRGLRYAVAIDDEGPQIVDVDAEEFSKTWSVNVIRAAAFGVTDHTIKGSGQHTLKVWMVDPGVVLDKIVIDLGGVKPSHLGPPESRAASR